MVGLVVTAVASCLSSLPVALAITSLGDFPLLLLPAMRSSTCFATGRSRAARILLLLARQPLLLREHELAADGHGLVRRLVVEVVHRLQPPDDLLDGEVLKLSSFSMVILSWAYFLGWLEGASPPLAPRRGSSRRGGSSAASAW